MYERLGSLYHWSPKSRRPFILREGLILLSRNVTHSSGRFAYLCFSGSPRAAWELSGGWKHCEHTDGYEEVWDLWQVVPAYGDEIRIEPLYGAVMHEIRIYNSIPPDRIFWCGERTLMAHETLDIPENKPDHDNR